MQVINSTLLFSRIFFSLSILPFLLKAVIHPSSQDLIFKLCRFSRGHKSESDVKDDERHSVSALKGLDLERVEMLGLKRYFPLERKYLRGHCF